MVNNPLVSIPILTYNHENYIEQCIESVFAQKTNFGFEVIVGEDCSTDGTRLVLQQLEAKYKNRLHVIYHESNVGFMRNGFEYCFPLCRGKYIACLDGDDYWDNDNKLQMQVEALEKQKNTVICFTDVKFLDDSTQKFVANTALPHINKSRFNIKDILKLNIISTGTVVFKNLFTKGLPARFIEFPYGDWPMFLFLLLHGDAIYLPISTCVYRKHNGGVFTSSGFEKRVLTDIYIYDKLLGYKEFSSYKNLIQRQISEKSYVALCLEIKKGKPDYHLMDHYYEKTVKYAAITNIYYPAKAFIRKGLATIKTSTKGEFA